MYEKPSIIYVWISEYINVSRKGDKYAIFKESVTESKCTVVA